MFTGVIAELGTVRTVGNVGESARIAIEVSFVLQIQPGESIAVNGVCLTATGLQSGAFTADVSPETRRTTTLGGLRRAEKVNIERALAFGDRLGGHLVYGHVDGIGTLRERRVERNAHVLTFEAPPEVAGYVVDRGSVAVEGVSLTAYDVTASGFTVSVIPHTAVETTLGLMVPGTPVNLEADMLGKYVEKLLKGKTFGEGLTMDVLKQYGYA